MSGDPRPVWRFSIEYSSPNDDCTVTRAGRVRAFSENAVEDWLVADLHKKYGDDFTVVKCDIWPAANKADDGSVPVIFTPPIKQSNIPPVIAACALPQPKPPEKKQEEDSTPSMKWFEPYAVTPGYGLGGSSQKHDKFYASVKEATSL